MTAKVRTVPRPLAWNHSLRSERQLSQCMRAGRRACPQSRQRMSMRRPSRAPSKKGWDASSGSGTGFISIGSVIGSTRVGAEDEGPVVAEDAPVAGAEDDVVLLDLAFTALSSALDDGFAERGHAPHVVAGELAAAGVGRERAARAELAVFDECSSFALLAEAVVL